MLNAYEENLIRFIRRTQLLYAHKDAKFIESQVNGFNGKTVCGHIQFAGAEEIHDDDSSNETRGIG